MAAPALAQDGCGGGKDDDSELEDEDGLDPDYVDSIQPEGAETGGLAVLASGMASRPGGVRIHQHRAQGRRTADVHAAAGG